MKACLCSIQMFCYKRNHHFIKMYTLDLLAFCKKIASYVAYYKSQIKSYNGTAHNILKNETDLILPQLLTKQKCGIITTLVSSSIGLAYEGISSFLHNKRHKALYKAVKAMNSKTTIQHNKVMHLENSMVMWGHVYNAETLEHLINTVHHIHNIISSNEKMFAGQDGSLTLQSLYANVKGIQHYSITSLLYLRTVKDKYVLLYKELITQLQIYTAIRILAKGYLPIPLITPLKLKEILNEARITVQKTIQIMIWLLRG